MHTHSFVQFNFWKKNAGYYTNKKCPIEIWTSNFIDSKSCQQLPYRQRDVSFMLGKNGYVHCENIQFRHFLWMYFVQINHMLRRSSGTVYTSIKSPSKMENHRKFGCLWYVWHRLIRDQGGVLMIVVDYYLTTHK